MPPHAADTAERTARHLSLLQEAAQISITLMRAIAAEAMDPPPVQDEPNAKPAATKSEAAAIIDRLGRGLRQAIALEARLAADRDAAARSPAHIRDERRDYLRRVVHNVATDRPDGLDFKRHALEQIDATLAADTSASAADLLALISETLGIIVTPEQLPPYTSTEMWPTIGTPEQRQQHQPGHARRT